MNENQNVSAPQIIRIRKNSRKSLKQLKQSHKKGDIETIFKVADGNFSITTADRWQYCPIYLDIGTYILPGKGAYVDTDYRLDLSQAEFAYRIYSDASFMLMGFVLHVYETGSSALQTTELELIGTKTMEEGIDELIPSDGYDHDYVVFGQIEPYPFFTNGNKYEVKGKYDFLDIYNRIKNDWFQSPAPRDRKYEIGFLTYSPSAGNSINYRCLKTIRGRWKPFRSSLI